MKHFNVSNLNEKKLCFRIAVPLAMILLMTTNVLAAGNMFDSVVNPIVELLEQLTGPALALVGAIGSLYCVLLGVKFAKAEEPQEREKAKHHLKNAIIGFALIFILIVALHFGIRVMTNWASQQTGTDYTIE